MPKLALPVCICCEGEGTVLLNGTYFCPVHAICASCNRGLQNGEHPLTCRCHAYSFSGHEENLYCSEACLDATHPEPDYRVEEAG